MLKGVVVGNLMIDCGDAEALCTFYHRLLGWERCTKYGCPAVQGPEGLLLLFMQEEGYVPPVWPEELGKQQKQMHFDFQVSSMAEAVAYAETLGAVRTKEQFGGEEWVTMLDPSGHPFCLCLDSNPA